MNERKKGVIIRIVPEKKFGVVKLDGNRTFLFFANDMPPEIPFDESAKGKRVSFDLKEDSVGVRAVRLVSI